MERDPTLAAFVAAEIARAGVKAGDPKVKKRASVFGISLIHDGLPACHSRETYGQARGFRPPGARSMNLR